MCFPAIAFNFLIFKKAFNWFFLASIQFEFLMMKQKLLSLQFTVVFFQLESAITFPFHFSGIASKASTTSQSFRFDHQINSSAF